MGARGWLRDRRQPHIQRLLGMASLFAIAFIAAYVTVRLGVVIADAGSRPADRLMALLLLLAELFMCTHGFGFFGSVVKSLRGQAKAPPPLFTSHCEAPVAVLIATYNESEEMLESTIASVLAMDYPAQRVYLLDDSTRPECQQAAERLERLYGITLVRRPHRLGYKAGAINDVIPRLSEPYVAILDADQQPLQSWLKEVVPLLEADPRLALVQVPQIYVETEGLPVAEAAKYQQSVFFEYICEGKAASEAMFCCGSNVVLRRAALLSIERVAEGRHLYLDETSVTEDFATSMVLHERGWRTAYVNRPLVRGMGPETLSAYFTQQARWAMGTLGVGLRALRRIWRQPRALRPEQWWEYLLSGTYYLIGFANFVFMLAPICFLGLGVRPLRVNADLYLLVLAPYVAFTLALFYTGMRVRGLPVRGVWLAAALSFATFWVYMKAAVVALLGRRRAFGVTPKGVGGALPLQALWAEAVMLALTLGALIGALVHLAVGGFDLAYAVNAVWAGHSATQLATLFLHFNRPVTFAPRLALFAPAAAA